MSNRSQAVRIPKELAFPDDVKEVYVIRRGKRLEIIPVDSLWDDFFDRPPNPDFPERDQPPAQERDFDWLHALCSLRMCASTRCEIRKSNMVANFNTGAHSPPMNAHLKFPRMAAVFKSNRSQAVRIPKDLEFPEGVKKVLVRKVGKALMLAPADAFWDDFFARPGIDIEEPEELPYETRESF
jgi:antitoxin VapB